MTDQIDEILLLGGQAMTLTTYPPIPNDHPRIILRDRDAIDRNGPDYDCFSTACWRGYRGTWEVKDDRLLLASIVGRYALRGADPVPATWISEVLIAPHGEVLYYVNCGLTAVCEFETHVRVEQGTVTSIQESDNRGTRPPLPRQKVFERFGPPSFAGLRAMAAWQSRTVTDEEFVLQFWDALDKNPHPDTINSFMVALTSPCIGYVLDAIRATASGSSPIDDRGEGVDRCSASPKAIAVARAWLTAPIDRRRD